MGLSVVTVASGGLPVVEATFGTPVTEAVNGRGVPVTKVVGKPGLPVVFETIGVGAVTYPTWDLATVSNMTLSNGSLRATSTGSGYALIPVAQRRTSGKYYWEYTVVNHTNINTSMGVNGSSINAIVTVVGSILVNAVSTGWSLGSISIGHVVGVALDIPAKLIWFKNITNSSAWNTSGGNPATGTSGANISAIVGPITPTFTATLASQVLDANFGASAFVGPVPAGFTAGWPA